MAGSRESRPTSASQAEQLQTDLASVGLPHGPRQGVSMNHGWRFTMGDPMFLQPHFSYESAKPWFLFSSNPMRGATATLHARPEGNLGSDIVYVDPAFDDSAWRKLDLPHEWGIEGPFRQNSPGGNGKLPYAGIGWYRKNFALPASDAGRKIFLDLDGAMSFAMVWLNGQFVGGWPSGYTSFRLDLTGFAKAGEDNVLAIRLDNPPESSRWYPGGGIYRRIGLTKTHPIHFAQWGVFVSTPRASNDAAYVAVHVLTDNETTAPVELTLRNAIFPLDAQGQKTGTPLVGEPIRIRIPSCRQSSSSQEIVVHNPRLWSVRTPDRYVVVTTIHLGDEMIDRLETPFGIRTIAFDAERGFLLNDESLRLQGVCMHSDLGALGVAVHPRAIERQLEILKTMGANAIRTSHNPPAPELLDACDRLGFLVIDEAFDCWQKGKCRNGYHRLFPDWHEADLRALVRRDRNHPCVILWSIGNEVIEQWRDDGAIGWKLAAALSGIVHQEDRTRPVTAAFNNPACGFNGFQNAVDVMGYNYQIGSYRAFRQATPSIPLLGSETASTISSRGEYFFPLSDNKTDPVARSNFQVTPHIAGSVGPECRRMSRLMIEELGRYLNGEPLKWQITPVIASADEWRASSDRLIGAAS